MHFKMITSSDPLWNQVRDYANNCSWRAGQSLASAMDNNLFTEWERDSLFHAPHHNSLLCHQQAL